MTWLWNDHERGPRSAADAIVGRNLELIARRHFPLLQATADSVAWVLALFAATYLRYDMRVAPINERGVLLACVLAIVCQVGVGLALGLYRRHFHYGSFDEVRVLAPAMACTALTLFFVVAVEGGGLMPRSVPLLAGFLALVIASAWRFLQRLHEDSVLRPRSDGSEPLVVIGAGRVGTHLVRGMVRSPNGAYRPVAVLDDDPNKRQLRFGGVRVVGASGDALAVSKRFAARSVLIAAPRLSNERLRELADPLLDAGIEVLLPPPVVSPMQSAPAPDSMRRLTAVDLLGRHPADVDLDSIAHYIAGKRVLVTGAGGSIGSELCRQLHRFAPATLAMLDRDESGLHATQLSIEGRALLDTPHLVLADIRDRDRVFQALQEHRPHVVFHAAALKHMPLLEFNPAEAWKTNVVGTRNVLEAAEAVGVERFVNISTDKAADPENVLGYTKRLCERMTAATADATGRPYVSVRFGNVLGSRGSVLEVFRQQIATGGPVTVTDAEVSRFFMTVEEAVALTIQAGALGCRGEVLVLDMGQPVKILEVVHRLAQEAHTEVDVVYTGLRPGEKLHEVLFGAAEVASRPHHPLIAHVPVPPLSFDEARELCSTNGSLRVTPSRLASASSTIIKERPPQMPPVGGIIADHVAAG